MSVITNIAEYKDAIHQLNTYANAYYNENQSLVPNSMYDELYDAVCKFENESGIVSSASPTQFVGYEVVGNLKKVTHSHPMLSLDKTKFANDLISFAGDQDCILSLKMDGLTILLTYDNGNLVRAETRGDGEIGEDVTHNARVFKNIPLTIPYPGHYEIEGEAIITYDDFNRINAESESEYKNPRNLASGSVRQLDSGIAAKRSLRFIAWKVPGETESMLSGLRKAKLMGFDVVPLLTYSRKFDGEHIQEMIQALKNSAKRYSYPIDGIVMAFDDVKYGQSLGATDHHPLHSIAFKFKDDVYETVLRDIEWSMGKTGVLTPTAVFDPVEIDGSVVSRASVHNVSILKTLNLRVGDGITVFKANQIIPQIAENISVKEDRTGFDEHLLPNICPVCGHPTAIQQEKDSENLVCTNYDCRGKQIGQLVHFVSKQAMNIDGLSESTLKKLIEYDMIEDAADIYFLNRWRSKMIQLPGFGIRSVDKLLDSIEASKVTTLARFINALCIPNVGKTASRAIANHFETFDAFYNQCCESEFDFTTLPGFGKQINESLNRHLHEYKDWIADLANRLTFYNNRELSNAVPDYKKCLEGKTFVITGKLNHFTNRDNAVFNIVSYGGKVSGTVNLKTDYLVNNDINSTSGKNKKAKELGIPIITEEELLVMMEGN